MTKEIVLGSGALYLAKYKRGDEVVLANFCNTQNRIGLIQGGCTLEYKPTTYEVKDDMNVIYKRFITSEEATIKSGILTWDVKALHSILSNHSYNDTNQIYTIKLGGLGAREMDEMVVVFEHKKKDGTVIRVGMVATNDAGITLAFQPDKETVVDAEFHSIGCDDQGTLVIIEEDGTALVKDEDEGVEEP